MRHLPCKPKNKGCSKCRYQTNASARPIGSLVNIPSRKVPKTGPFISEPILFIATITVLRYHLRKKIEPKLSNPTAWLSIETPEVLFLRYRPMGLRYLTKSSNVVADRLFITESSDDIAAAKSATSDSPTKPISNFALKKSVQLNEILNSIACRNVFESLGWMKQTHQFQLRPCSRARLLEIARSIYE